MKKGGPFLLDTVKPYQLIFGIFGTAPLPVYTKNVPIRTTISFLFICYKIVVIAASLYVISEGFDLVRFSNYLNSDFLTNGLQFAQILTMIVIQAIMQVIAFSKYNNLKRICLEINTMEKDLLRFTSSLDKSPSQISFKWELFCICGLMVFTIFMIPISNIDSILQNKYPLTLWIISTTSDMSIRCKSVEFCVMVQVFNQLLRELLICIVESQKKCNSSTERFLIDRLLLQKRIEFIQNLQSRIWRAINALMDYFSLSILLQFLYSGLTMTHLIYWIYLKFDEEIYFINLSRLSTLSGLLLDIFLACYLCDVCVQTYGKIIRVINDFKPSDGDIMMKMCLREYSLQLTHQKMIFSCGGYFNINLQCFGEIVLAITTYIVILIQFKLQAEKT